jgi:hypothetical protein
MSFYVIAQTRSISATAPWGLAAIDRVDVGQHLQSHLGFLGGTVGDATKMPAVLAGAAIPF